MKLNFDYPPFAQINPEIIEQNHSVIVGSFLRALLVDTISVNYPPEAPKPTPRKSSLDSIPTKDSSTKEPKPDLVIYPTELHLEKENDLKVSFPIGYSGKPREIRLNYDSKRIRVTPNKFNLRAQDPVTITVIPLDPTTWDGSMNIEIMGTIRLVKLHHKGLPRPSVEKVPQLVMSDNFVDFGMVEPRASSERLLKLINNDQISYSWLLQSRDSGSTSVFTLNPREGVIEPGKECVFQVKFNPRLPGSFQQDWILEYHIKGLMGLAKTIKKIPIKAAGKSRVSRALKASPPNVVFPKPTGGQKQAVIKVQLQNRTHEKVNVNISQPDEPFSVRRVQLEMKPRYYIDLPIVINYSKTSDGRRYTSQVEVKSTSGDTEIITLEVDLS